MNKRILVVDDSPTIRALLSFILKTAGFETRTASDGIEALETIYLNDFDLLVCDINMPKMDGLTLIKTLRAQEEYRNIPIIIITTESEEEDRKKGIEAGANVYLVKPTQPEHLIQNVKMLLT